MESTRARPAMVSSATMPSMFAYDTPPQVLLRIKHVFPLAALPIRLRSPITEIGVSDLQPSEDVSVESIPL